MQKVGYEIHKSKIDERISPLTFGITGMNGRVGRGALEILNYFPNRIVTFEEVEDILRTKDDPIH